MEKEGVGVFEVRADHVKLYKRALLEARMSRSTVARRLSVLRGTYRELASKGLVRWEVAQDISAINAPPVQKNSTPALTQKQAIALLEVIPRHTLQGCRDFALMSVFFITGCRVSAVISSRVGDLESDGVDHFLLVTEKRGKRQRKILLDAARAVLTYIERAGIRVDREGPLFRPLSRDGCSFVRRHLDRKTPWRLVKHYCRAAGIDPGRLGGRGVGVHSLRKTAINDAIRNGAQMHEVREFAGHSDIRTTELYFVRKEEDGEMAARRIHIRVRSLYPRTAKPGAFTST
jgi:site-specific recombinase XerD